MLDVFVEDLHRLLHYPVGRAVWQKSCDRVDPGCGDCFASAKRDSDLRHDGVVWLNVDHVPGQSCDRCKSCCEGPAQFYENANFHLCVVEFLQRGVQHRGGERWCSLNVGCQCCDLQLPNASLDVALDRNLVERESFRESSEVAELGRWCPVASRDPLHDDCGRGGCLWTSWCW